MITKAKPMDRRLFMQSSIALLASQISLSACDDNAGTHDIRQSLSHIDKSNNGRLGLSVYSKNLSYDVLMKDNSIAFGPMRTAKERFGMCSTFKLPLAAMILRAIDQGDIKTDTRIPISESDILSYAPVTKKHLEQGYMSAIALAEAAQKTSDNTAANLLLPLIGGTDGFTQNLRALGDETSRLDRIEPTMNLVTAGEIRDTTTPHAMARLLSVILETDYLSDASRALLKQWMIDTTTGSRRVRAGLTDGGPDDWLAGNKTGTGIAPSMANIYGDIGVIWPPNQPPIYFAAYFQAEQYYDSIRPQDEKILADTGKIIAINNTNLK